jgi:type I restriction enzyme R subunit
MKHKNIALELLKRLFNDEIKARSKTNLVKAKSIKQMLDEAIKNYHNKSITALEVIEELIEFAKDLNNADCEATKLKLTKYEYAFYSAVAANGSARELMQQDVLRELAVAPTTSVKKNTSIDWQQKHSPRAKLRTVIKRLLRKYGYPPDMQQLAIDNVIAQAELMATSC